MHNINIYVGKLPPNFTAEDLRQKFVTFGEVVSVTLMNDKYISSGQPQAYGYIEMATRSEGETAIKMLTGERFGGSVIDIVEALPLSDKRCPAPVKRTSNRWGKQKRRQRE
jgi:RNA recognition motif-containing protein